LAGATLSLPVLADAGHTTMGKEITTITKIRGATVGIGAFP
jgi:hypothetical protein